MKNLEEVNDDCITKGMIINLKDIDIRKILNMLRIADEDLQLTDDAKRRNSINSMFKLYYDVVHTLTEALLRFDKISSSNHQCLFTYLCSKHEDLDLDWIFFETIRLLRNGVCYDGNLIKETDWKNIEFQINLCIRTLKKEIERKIREFK
jgi:hypothetical protein